MDTQKNGLARADRYQRWSDVVGILCIVPVLCLLFFPKGSDAWNAAVALTIIGAIGTIVLVARADHARKKHTNGSAPK